MCFYVIISCFFTQEDKMTYEIDIEKKVRELKIKKANETRYSDGNPRVYLIC